MTKEIDEKKLREWAKDAQRGLEESQRRIGVLERASLSGQEEYRYDPVPRHPIPPKDKVEFYKRRDRLRQVQIWTSAGEDEEGNHLLCSLDWPEPIAAVSVYLATHDIDSLLSDPFDKWLAETLGEDGDEN